MTQWTSEIVNVPSVQQWLEMAYENRWTDGLPVVPPTEEAVADMLRGTDRSPDESLGTVPPTYGIASIEKIAIQCVMAGCKPEYMPIVLAALEAMMDRSFNLSGIVTTTHSCHPLTIVSGPIVKDLGFNYKENVFGGGSRANATIGRAISLILWNIGGAYPGETDMTHLGHPGSYSYCIAEHPDENPWEPVHVERAKLPAETSAVTVFACEAPHGVKVPERLNPHLTPGILFRFLADSMKAIGVNNTLVLGQTLVVIGPKGAQYLADHGFTKEDVRLALYEEARHRLGDLTSMGYYWPEDGNVDWTTKAAWIDQTDPETRVPIVERPENILITVTGASRLIWCAVCPGWGHFGGYAATKAIRLPTSKKS